VDRDKAFDRKPRLTIEILAALQSSLAHIKDEIMWRTSVVVVVLFGITGCVAMANSPMVARQLKIVSAGHTGCLPEDNELSNISLSGDGSGIWNAACKGKIYLCSAVGSAGGNSESFSCALVAN
jgi:hypothetical protein